MWVPKVENENTSTYNYFIAQWLQCSTKGQVSRRVEAQGLRWQELNW